MSVYHWPNYLKIIIFTIIIGTMWLFNGPFITPIFMGFFFAVLTLPVFELLQKKLGSYCKGFTNGVATALTIVLVSALMIFGINFIASQIISEIPKFVTQIVSILQGFKENKELVDWIANKGVARESIYQVLDSALSNFNSRRGAFDLTNIVNSDKTQQIFSVSSQIFNFLFMSITNIVLFVLAWITGLNDGKKWIHSVLDCFPFTDSEVATIKSEVRKTINNVIFANLLSGLLNSTLAFVIMFCLGVPNIWIYTILIFFIGFLPLSPNEFAYLIPLSAAFSANLWLGLVLTIICEIFILWINYSFLPKVIATSKNASPLLIITSVLSGIVIFGPLGFIIGPVVLAMIKTLYSILIKHIKLTKHEIIENE